MPTPPTRTIRFYALGLELALGVAIYAYFLLAVPLSPLRLTLLSQTYGLFSLSLLYLCLLVTPLTQAFPGLPFREQAVLCRRPLGVGAAIFALLHSLIGFFWELGGFAGLRFLDATYLASAAISLLALAILLLLLVTSFDQMMRRLGPGWKRLHRWVYLAGLLIVIHVLVIGSHYADPANPWYRFSFLAFAFLMMLQALRLDRWLAGRLKRPVAFGPVSLLTVGSLVVGLTTFAGGLSAFSAHAGHGAAAVPTSAPAVHYHANFQIYVKGAPVDFSGARYMEPVSLCTVAATSGVTPESRVHLHNGDGSLVHVHSANVTWGDLFANLGWAVSPHGVVAADGTVYAGMVTSILNGVQVANPAAAFIRSEDRLLVDVGDDPAAAQSHFAGVPSTARQANLTNDPATCSGS